MKLENAIEIGCTYFTRPGPANTEETLRLAKKRAEELGIKTVVVATTQGHTGVAAARFFPGYRVIVVTHAAGFKTPNTEELTEENRAAIQQAGGIIYTGTHSFAGVGRAVRRKFQTYQVDDIMANTLRLLGQGIKVVCEIAAMAADAGLVRTDEEVIAIAGTGRGADTAVVIQPANSQDFFDIKVKELLCKPR